MIMGGLLVGLGKGKRMLSVVLGFCFGYKFLLIQSYDITVVQFFSESSVWLVFVSSKQFVASGTTEGTEALYCPVLLNVLKYWSLSSIKRLTF